MANAFNTLDINQTAKQHRSGAVAVTALDTTKAVVFSAPLGSANYTVLFERGSAAAAALWVTSKTTAGFTINLSVGVVDTLRYVAIEDWHG
jgi:hypothetical protein